MLCAPVARSALMENRDGNDQERLNEEAAAFAELERDAGRLAAVFLRAAGGRLQVSERDMREIGGTVRREERPDGSTVFTLISR